MKSTFSRRALLVQSSSFVAIAAIGGGALVSLNEDDIIQNMLERSVGSFEMKSLDFSAFKAQFFKIASVNTIESVAYNAAEVLGQTSNITKNAPEAIASNFERFERALITYFLTHTTFLQKDRGADPVTFLGPQACVNPFANFAFD